MQDFPHHYGVVASAAADAGITLTSAGLSALPIEAPLEFGGPGDEWSPETMLVGAVASCFILTFRSVARAARLPWVSLTCEARGTLDRVDRVTQFTEMTLRATLRVPPGTAVDVATRALERAEHACLISNSLKAHCTLETDVQLTATNGVLA